jgi:excinuclease ABC subunit A
VAAGVARPEPARHPGHARLRRRSPWRELPKKDRDWILFTDEQPTVPVYAGSTPDEVRRALKRKEEPSYMGTFTERARYVLHTFANTQSALMKKRVARTW